MVLVAHAVLHETRHYFNPQLRKNGNCDVDRSASYLCIVQGLSSTVLWMEITTPRTLWEI